MSAGLQYDEWSYPYTDSRNDHVRMNRSSDPIRFVLGLPVEAAPGTKFVYKSGLSITLGGIVEKASALLFSLPQAHNIALALSAG